MEMSGQGRGEADYERGHEVGEGGEVRGRGGASSTSDNSDLASWEVTNLSYLLQLTVLSFLLAAACIHPTLLWCWLPSVSVWEETLSALHALGDARVPHHGVLQVLYYVRGQIVE